MVNHLKALTRSTSTYNDEAVPKTAEPDIFVYSVHGASKSFSGLPIRVELAHHDIGWVGDNGAEDSGKVAASKRDTGLNRFPIFGLALRHLAIDGFHDGLETGKLHHRVRDLSTPEWVESLIQAMRL